MDGRGGVDNTSATSAAEGSSSKQGGMKICGQIRHQRASASRLNKVTG